MNKIVFFCAFCVCYCFMQAQNSEVVIDKVVFCRNGSDLNRLSILLPIPQSNQYQIIHNVDYSGGVYCNINDADDKYARFQINNPISDSLSVNVTTQITYKIINIDISQIPENITYDTTSDEYILYTSATAGGYVDPTNSTIVAIADSIWNNSSGVVNYASNCYDYVATNFNYLNPYTGFYTLSQILANGGGDCGNLSSIFISLLRCKKIPSRHVVAFFSNGDFHVWAEFKVDGYGWIPVDVTFHQSNPNGNYFGHYDYNAVVVGYDIGHTYSRWGTSDIYEAATLQTYHWWWWGRNGDSATCQLQISKGSSAGITANEIAVQDINIYQNGGSIVIDFEKYAGSKTLSVFDLLGHCIFKRKEIANNKEIIPVPKSGIYLIKIGDILSKKIVVFK